MFCVDFAIDRTCCTGWTPSPEEADDFKDTFIPNCVMVLVNVANRLQKKYSQVSLVKFWQNYNTNISNSY